MWAPGKKEARRWLSLALSLVGPVALFVLRPFGMDARQSMMLAGLCLTILWWSTGIVGKIPASCFLLGLFALGSGAPLKTIFSFPLSETFLLITLTYLFSRGIEKSGLAERLLEPLLFRYVDTPVKAFLSVILALIATIYIIPQPLARLIILAGIYRGFLEKTSAKSGVRAIILFSIFVFYVVVNMIALDADIILNNAAAGFAGLTVSNGEWILDMAVPTLVFCAAVLGLLYLVFRRELKGQAVKPLEDARPKGAPPFTLKDKLVAAVVAGTVLLWMAEGLFGGVLPFSINPTVVTLAGTGLLFALGALKIKDFRAIDVTTLVFLSAALSIGGVMKETGIADIVFSRVAGIFPASYSLGYVAAAVLVSMGMHLILGSNTTTLSVVLPGLVLIGTGILPAKLTLLICYTSLCSHYLLPFHAVSMMIGVSNGYFPTRYVVKFGALVMLLLFAFIFLVFLPWWQLRGLA